MSHKIKHDDIINFCLVNMMELFTITDYKE